MRSLICARTAAAGALLLGALAFSPGLLSHQSEGRCDGHKGPMGGISMLHEMPMMGGGSMGTMGSMMGGHKGMMGGFHHEMMRIMKLDLSDEQTEKMHDIHHRLRKEHWAVMGQMIDQHAALRKAHAGDRPDPKAVGAVYGKIFDLRRQMIEAAVAARNEALNLLTDEQTAQLEQMRKRRRGMMRGHGGMMRGQGGMMQGQGGQDG